MSAKDSFSLSLIAGWFYTWVEFPAGCLEAAEFSDRIDAVESLMEQRISWYGEEQCRLGD
jgi:hypothetical protein